MFLFSFFFSIKSLTVGKLDPSSPHLPSPVVSVARPCFFLFFYKSKQTRKTWEESTVKAVKIDTYYPNILKHIRKGLCFSFWRFWLGCHTRSDLLSLNDECYGGLHECVHVVYVCNVYGNCLFVCFLKHLQRGFCWVTQQDSRLASYTQRAHTKLREKERHSDRRLEEALALTLI